MRFNLNLCVFILFPIVTFSQEIPADLLKKMEQVKADSALIAKPGIPFFYPVENGKITFADGTSSRFTGLVQSGDSVSFTNMRGRPVKKAWYEIAKITEHDPKTGEGALIGGGTGLVSGVLIGFLAYPENNFLETLIQLLINDEENTPELSKKAIPLIAGMTAAGTAIGAIAGASNKKIIFKSRFQGTFYPETTHIPGPKQGMMITWAINF